jgi:hypothetical protein
LRSPRRLDGALATRLPGFRDLLPGVRLHSGRLARFLTTRLRAEAFVLGRHIFLSSLATGAIARQTAGAVELLAHELTHIRQFRRYGIAPFLGRYLGEYLSARARGRPHSEAYRAISFEREAQEAARACAAGSPGFL